MKPSSGDNQNETRTEGPRVLKVASTDEFQQSVAVAQLAIKLCKLEIAKRQTSLQKENLDSAKFLDQAWELIESARDHVLRSQTDTEYLVSHCGTPEAGENVVARILSASRVPFKKLCNKKETYTTIKLHDAETRKVIEVEWRVYKSEAGFNKLFWAYWRVTSILRVRMIVSPNVPGNAPDNLEEYGEALLASWKKDGVPPNEFLALARFRREHDRRGENLKKEAETVA